MKPNEVKLIQVGSDLFRVQHTREDGKERPVHFFGVDAEERAKDYAGALQIILDHTEPGTTMTEIFEEIFHGSDEEEGGNRDVVELL